MIYYRDRMCYIVLREGDRTVQIAHTVPTNPQIAEELLHMHLAKAYGQTNKDREKMSISRFTEEQGEVW